MRICVLGLWHLGSVTAAGLAQLGHQVRATDFAAPRVAALAAGAAAVFEPGLEELLRQGLSSGNLSAVSPQEGLRDAEVVWVTYDTPVDSEDGADVGFVMGQLERALQLMNADSLLLVSSQLPVGSIGRLERMATSREGGGVSLRAASCPENLRLGSAIADFLHPRRLVVGVRSERDRELLSELFAPLTDSIEWMSVESAEMTKHAINAFLATSITFANEIAGLCESVGADATEVARGLKSEPRIGPRAYVAPGGAFSGGTLARDVSLLNQVAHQHSVSTPLLTAVLPSNRMHSLWARRKLRKHHADLSACTVAVWGLTYKPGTDTLRRSLAVELCDWLLSEGVTVRVHDPLARDLPAHWLGRVSRVTDPLEAVAGADALIVATPWPEYRQICAADLLKRTSSLLVLDESRFLPQLATEPQYLRYLSVGLPESDG